MKFRYKPGIALPYERQGYIYFKSLSYSHMSAQERERVRSLCTTVGGEHGQALLEHVTTGESIKSVCQRHYIASPTSLYRALKRYYERFPYEL